jgi:hypothetical protein
MYEVEGARSSLENEMGKLEDSASLDQTKGANEEDFHQVMAKIKL